MLDIVSVALSGLAAYQRGLGVISDNVANLNTPGHKASRALFTDLMTTGRQADSDSDGHPLRSGGGVAVAGTQLLTQAGEARQTGQDLDVLIDGPGLFVLRETDGRLAYSRAGRFELDGQGQLVEAASGAAVLGRDVGGGLQPLGVGGARSSPPLATTRLLFKGNLSSGDTQHIPADITVYDALGSASTLRVTFDNTSSTLSGSWRVSVATLAGASLGDGELRMSNGRPQPGFDRVDIYGGPTGGLLTLDFGSGVTGTQTGTDSSLALDTQDGRATGALLKTTFDAQGQFVATYGNSDKRTLGRLALAFFVSAEALVQTGGNRLASRDGRPPELGNPGEGGLGRITAGSIEMSNVDLAREFGEMIITQRGYQASSQVLTTANELMQQLIELRGRR